MKKLIIFVFVFICLALTGLTIYFIGQPKIDEHYYSLKSNMCYINEEDSLMNVSIYSTDANSIIQYSNSNLYTLNYENGSTVLTFASSSITKVSNYYLYELRFKLPTPYDSFKDTKVSILIENEKFSLDLDVGYLTICDKTGFELLGISELYGSYSYINKELLLTGINITLNKNFNKITSIKVGPNIYGDLDNIIFDAKMDNIIDINKVIPNYKFFYGYQNSSKTIISRTMFIPLQYERINLTTNSYILFVIDDKKYYLDNFSYYGSIIDINNYPSLKTEGKLVYAKA